ncbi:MAG: chemotaxis protein CheW [Steroidobacteraceae bacterium]|nr:chemotaxis protein CheW [Steroidobacteraceae bacterium]
MTAEDLYGLLVPLLDERLLVPRACVAEVTGMQVLQEMPGAPPWYLGITPWNGRSIPVISFEGACGQRIPSVGGRTRIVVFTCLGQKLPAGHFGIVTQGFPQLVRVSSTVIAPDNSRVFGERQPVLCQVRMVNELPLVPDIERLEEMIADETTVTA